MAKLVKLGEEEVEVLGVICATLGQVQRVQLLVLHQDELEDFPFDLSNNEASHLEDVESATLIQNRLTHIVETLVVEDNVGDVEFADGARVSQDSPNRSTMHLLIKVHVLEADLDKFLVHLHALGKFFEIYDVIERDAHEADCLDLRLVFEPFSKHASCFTRQSALLKPQVYDSGLLWRRIFDIYSLVIFFLLFLFLLSFLFLSIARVQVNRVKQVLHGDR